MIKDIIITEQISISPKLLNNKLLTIIENIFHIIYLSNIISYNPFLTYKFTRNTSRF